MAAGEVTGGTAQDIAELRFEFQQTPLHEDHGVSFEAAFCVVPIGKQPDEYDGPQRYCQRRVGKLEGRKDEYTDDAYKHNCRYHGGKCGCDRNTDNLEPYTAGITHGIYADDEHLRMDFNDAEQNLYDSIVEVWPEVYDWPAEDEDPARYLILRKVATNVVRSNRAEDYLDEEGEVHFQEIFSEDGVVVGEEPQENPLAGEYRLLVDEILSLLKELGLTPKERAKMDKVEAEAGAAETVADLAGNALDSDDGEYDPEQFTDDGP